MEKVKVISFGFLAALLLMLPVEVKSASGKFKPGNIKIGQIVSLTGFNADTGQQVRNAHADYFRWLNEEKGGIRGHKIEHIVADDGYNMKKTVDLYKRMKDVEKVHVITLICSGGATVLNPIAREDKMPIITQIEITGVIPSEGGYTFSVAPFYTDQVKLWPKWISDNWKDTTKRPVIGHVFLDASAGWSTNKALKMACKKYNCVMGPELSCPVTTSDFTSEIMILKKAKVDAVYNLQISATGIALIKDADRFGLDVPLGFLTGLFMRPVMDALGKIAEKGNLYCTAWYYPWREVDKPGIKLAHELNEKWHPEIPWQSGIYWLGWAQASIAAEAIGLAIDAVGYDNLSGEAIRDHGFHNMKNYDNGMMPPVSYGPKKHWGSDETRILRWFEGGEVAASEWMKIPPRIPEENTAKFWTKK